MNIRVLPVLLLLPLTACQTGLGGTPRIVELYDAADPAGVLEIEMHRSGAIREIEAEIPISDLPDAVIQAAQKAAPGGEITGGEREITETGSGWEVQVRNDGADWEFVIDDEGNVLETEEPIGPGDGPAALVDNAAREVPNGGSLKSIERITFHGEVDTLEYHVKFEHNGASYKVVLDEQANVKRAVREQRAEIEIPLR